MDNIKRALDEKTEHVLIDSNCDCPTCTDVKILVNIIQNLYNIVEGKMFRTLSMAYSPDECKGYNDCKKEILSKFNDKLNIKE